MNVRSSAKRSTNGHRPADRDCLTVMDLHGDLDEATSDYLSVRARAMIEEGHAELVLDLSGVTSCDACGLAALIGIRRRALEAGGWLRLAAVPAELDRLLERTGLDRFLAGHRTVDAAVTDYRKGTTRAAI